MTKILILDDDQNRHRQFAVKYQSEDLTHVETATDAIEALKENQYDYVFLDHDLGDEIMVASGPGTGYEVAEWIANNLETKETTQVVLHSLNGPGRKNMMGVLKSGGVKSMEAPFLWT